MAHFEIEGGKELSGKVHIPGAKNAALPMLCGALLTEDLCIFENVPNIKDIQTLLEIFQEIGVEVNSDLKNNRVEIKAEKVDLEKLKNCEKLKKIRASILVLGPLLARFKKCRIFSPGGCVIGARSHAIHTDGFSVLGGEILEDGEQIDIRFNTPKLSQNRILLPEASVTGTENLALFLAGIEKETTEMYFVAAEPHVCATLKMLQKMGAQIEGIGTHHLKITGEKYLKGGTFTVPPDGILVGTYAIAGIITNSEITIKNVDHKELFSFYGILKRLGAQFEMGKNELIIKKRETLQAITKVQTAIYPGFSTDLQSPMGVLLTQCQGTSMLFETLFENRLAYLNELERMGARIQILNQHQAQITGVSKLKAAEVQSWDLRAGAAMVLAGLIAEGTTKVTNIQYIDRGYENFVEVLQSLGASIKRVTS